MTTSTTPKDYREAKAAGMVMVGEWGWGSTIRPAGGIWCQPENEVAVKAAYDAIPEQDLSSDVLDDVKDAGGVFVPDVE
jgi:hypothetical protein